MSLYDVIDEITARQVTKTETGDTRVYGVMLGVVAKNYDKDMGGRVCVTIPTRDKDANELQWARLSMPSSGKEWGYYFLPEVGDQVLLAFENGNIEKPYVIGCIPLDNNKFLTGSVDKDNQIKRIVTKHGSTIRFEDNATDEEGLKDKITIETAGSAHTVLMDNENKLIRIRDKAGENVIELGTESGSGKLDVKIKSSMSIKVGDSVTITINGETGGVTIKANDVKIEASKTASVKANEMLTLEGATTKVNAASGFKVEGGMITLSGAPVKLG